MTIGEKAKFIKESREKNYLFISPRMIKGGANLVSDYESLELYEKMNENTKKFAESEIVDLISSTKDGATNLLNFNLVFCGDFDDLPDNLGSPIDFILNNRDRIVAIYQYVESTTQRNFFIGFDQSETVYNYGYIYLSLSKLLEEFDNNNVMYKIDTTLDRFTRAAYRDDTVTKFVISYSPKKEIEDNKGPQLKKVRKDV